MWKICTGEKSPSFISQMNKRMMILLGLVLVSAGLLLTSFRLLGGKPAPTKTAEETKLDDSLQTDSQQTDTVVFHEEDFWKETPALLEKSRAARAPVFYHAPRRDPMRLTFTNGEISSVPPFKLIIKTPPATLTGVLLGNGKAAAIINEKIYRVGDLVDGRRIVAIERNRVILKRGPDEEILRLTSGI